MLKKIVLGLLCLSPLCLSAQNDLKIGYVSTQEIIIDMPQYKDMQTQIETMSKQFEDELVKFREEGQKKVKEYQELAQNKTTDETILKNRQEELAALDQRIQLFQQNAQEQLQKKQESLMMPIIESAKKAINDVASENNFTYILDSNAILFQSSKSENITALVKKKLGITTSAAPKTIK